jgi:hypothetical protein
VDDYCTTTSTDGGCNLPYASGKTCVAQCPFGSVISAVQAFTCQVCAFVDPTGTTCIATCKYYSEQDGAKVCNDNLNVPVSYSVVVE